MAAPQRELYTQGQIYQVNPQLRPQMHSKIQNCQGMLLMHLSLVSHTLYLNTGLKVVNAEEEVKI